MRHLSQALQDHDLIVLRVIGEWWDLDLTGEKKKRSIQQLVEALAQRSIQEELEFLPPEEADALRELVKHDGQIPVAQFGRQFGEIREMGPAALEREEPWFAPASPAEDLFYRGLIYKGFDDTEEGVVEFIYMPTELLAQLNGAIEPAESGERLAQPAEAADPTPLPTPKPDTKKVQAAKKEEADPIVVEPAPKQFESALTSTVDDATTLLTLAQTGRLTSDNLATVLPYTGQKSPVALGFLVQLLEEMNLMRFQKEGGYRPTKAAAGWLRAPREDALRQLFSAWRSSDWNALHHVPSLSCEGSGWHNDPIAPRKVILASFPHQPTWFEVSQLVSQIKKNDPDFQRPNGNYETWYIRDQQTGQFLSGFDQWEAIEGQLIHFIVHGPMYWLGMVDRTPTAVRPTSEMLRWLTDEPLPDPPEPVPITIKPEGVIVVGGKSDRFQRFQVGRFAELQSATSDQPYTYRITPGSLAQAREQGIPPERVLRFLQDTTEGKPPAGLRRAIERWMENGVEARLEKMVVLRVADGEILDVLRSQPTTKSLLGETLGELAVAVRADNWEALHAAAAQLGLLLDPIYMNR